MTTTTTKIINLFSIKCDTSLKSQDQRDLESDDDNDNDNDDDDKDINDNNNNDKNQLKVIMSILRALFIHGPCSHLHLSVKITPPRKPSNFISE